MKRIILSFIVSLLFIPNLLAQDQAGKISLGVNMSYASEKDLIGLGARVQYGFLGNFRGMAEYKYYLDRRDWSQWEINTDLHYVMGISERFSLYPIAGLKLSRWTVDTNRGSHNSNDRYKDSTTRLGVNLGLGGQFALSNNFFLQVEPKFEMTKHYSQFVGLVGLMIQF